MRHAHHHHPVVTRQRNLLFIKGILAIVWGVAALLPVVFDSRTLILGFGILNLAAAVLTFLYISRNRHLEISHQWLLIEGLIELAAGITFTFIVNKPALFVQFMSYGIIFLVFLQFIYGYSLLTNNRLNIANMAARFVNCIIGTLVAIILMTNVWGTAVSIMLIGGFSILFGILNAHFARKMRNLLLGRTE